MELIRCDRTHAEAIRGILNEAIANSTALYDYRPRTPAMMETWFATKEQGRFPVIGAVDEAGTLLGFSSYGTFRAWPAFKYSVEHSVYVDARHRGRGLGKVLLRAAIESAQAQDYHMMVGGIDAANTTSIALHVALGFRHCASIKQAGYKFGRWLDLEFYQLILPTPHQPTEG